jgi:hypothetical protein
MKKVPWYTLVRAKANYDTATKKYNLIFKKGSKLATATYLQPILMLTKLNYSFLPDTRKASCLELLTKPGTSNFALDIGDFSLNQKLKLQTDSLPNAAL